MKDLKNQKHYLINFKDKLINTKEIIDAILLNLNLNGKEGMNIGNVLKYVIRYKYKNGVEDLKKARNFLDYEIGDSPQETIKALESELNKVLDRNIELEMENERLKNCLHNSKIDFEKERKELKEEMRQTDSDWLKVFEQQKELMKKIIEKRERYKKRCKELEKKLNKDTNVRHQIDAWIITERKSNL